MRNRESLLNSSCTSMHRDRNPTSPLINVNEVWEKFVLNVVSLFVGRINLDCVKIV